MLGKSLPLLGALALAAPAHAVTVNMSDFSFAGPTTVEMTGTDGSPSFEGPAGRFEGTVVDDALLAAVESITAAATSPTSFIAWCAELTQTFSFGVSYEYTPVSGESYFGEKKYGDLSRLFTAAQGFVVDSRTSAALQAGIWEVIYEQGPSFSLTGGTFRGAPDDPAA